MPLSQDDKQTAWIIFAIGMLVLIVSYSISSGILVIQGMPQSVRDNYAGVAFIGLFIVAGSGAVLYAGTRK